MNSHYYLTFILCTALAIGHPNAQTVIRGEVIDASNGEPIIGASVEIQGTTQGGITDFNGKYYLKLDGHFLSPLRSPLPDMQL